LYDSRSLIPRKPDFRKNIRCMTAAIFFITSPEKTIELQ